MQTTLAYNFHSSNCLLVERGAGAPFNLEKTKAKRQDIIPIS